MNHNLCAYNGFLDIAPRPLFKSAGLLLPLTDDILNAFRELGDVFLLDILADLHRLFQFLKVWGFIGEDDDRLIVHLRIHDKLLIRRTVVVTCHGHNAQPHSTGSRAVQCLVHILVIGKIVLAVLKLLRRIDFSKYCLGDTRCHLCAVYHRVTDINGNILFFVGQESIGVPVSGDIVLR